MARQLVGKEYSNMDEEYRGRVSEDVFNSRKENQRMAGDAIVEVGDLEKFQDDAFNVDSIADFNFGAVGAGGAAGKGSSGLDDGDGGNDVFGRGRDRFSKFDAKGLIGAGFSAQELWDHGIANDGKGDFIFGDKAKRYLLNNGASDGSNPGGGDTGGGDDGGGDTGGGNPGGGNPGTGDPNPITNPDPPTSIYRGPNIQYFENIGGDITDSFNKNSGTINVNNGVENAILTDNSRIYGGNSNSFYYSGGNAIDDPYDKDPQSPIAYTTGISPQAFANNWLTKFNNRSRFSGG